MKKLIRRLFVLIILSAFIVGGYYAYKGYNMYKEALERTSIQDVVESIRSEDNYVSIDELPDTYKKAVIAVEDHRFYSHGAVDPIAIARALWNNFKSHKVIEGGSTIDQQLARNLYFTQEIKAERKFAEIFMAMNFERLYTKDEILELYVNTIYFGSGYYKVYDASMGYFKVKPQDMTDYESTLLAGIPNAPSVYSLNASPELASQRQKQVLSRMVKYGYLTDEEAESIFASGK